HMGKGLADGITQGGAGPDEFRTAPLWGVGQRIFFLHDGRTTNLVEVIRDHQSDGSEANEVIKRFNRLTTQEQQDVIDFFRSLYRRRAAAAVDARNGRSPGPARSG